MRGPIALTLGLGALFAGLLPAACLYDPDDPCGPNQTFEDDACVCVENAALIERNCVPCGENEVPGDGECVCEEGFERDSSGACGAAILGLGQDCSADPCPTEAEADGASVASYCATDAAGDYCTTVGCETFEDCPELWACDASIGDAGACVRPPSGFGTECSDSSACADFEASYCETLQENICMRECLDDPGVCHGDWVCCDFSNLVGTGLCVPPDQLEDGACPLGGELVEAP